MGHVLRPNTIKHRLETKQVDNVLSGQTVLLNMFDHRPNERNVLQCLIKCLPSFKFYHRQLNKIKQIKYDQKRCPNVWSPNNV